MTRIRVPDFFIAAIPVALIPGLVFAIAEGWLDFGGGEKDLVLVLPYAIWAVVFLVAGAVFIVRKQRRGAWARRSALWATGVLLVLGMFTYLIGFLGIA